MHLASTIVAIAGLSLALATARAQDPTPTLTDTLRANRPDTMAPQPVDIDTGAVQLDILTAEPPTLVPVKVSGTRGARGAYVPGVISSATKTSLPLRDIPQSVTVINRALMTDLSMQGMADVVRYTPGITMGQGEGHRDQPTIRGNNTTAGFFVNGMRDDVQYLRDLYNVERVEALKGANALIFGRGVGGGVLNRVTKAAGWTPTRELSLQGGSYGNKRGALDVGQGVSDAIALRLNGVYENSDLYRDEVNVERYGINPAATIQLAPRTQVLA